MRSVAFQALDYVAPSTIQSSNVKPIDPHTCNVARRERHIQRRPNISAQISPRAAGQ